MFYRMTAEKFEYETNSTQMRFVEWKPRMLRTKETQQENTSEWRGLKEGQQNKYLEDQDLYAILPWPTNWKSLLCNNMLTVDETQFLEQQKYFEANKFSTCEINSNRIILSLTL